jgi:hypothetical protein
MCSHRHAGEIDDVAVVEVVVFNHAATQAFKPIAWLTTIG